MNKIKKGISRTPLRQYVTETNICQHSSKRLETEQEISNNEDGSVYIDCPEIGVDQEFPFFGGDDET
jgi:hypothetical protein